MSAGNRSSPKRDGASPQPQPSTAHQQGEGGLGDVAVAVYAQSNGTTEEVARVAAAKSRVDEPDPAVENSEAASPGRAEEDPLVRQERAAAVLRARLRDAYQAEAGASGDGAVRNFVPPPLFLPPSKRQKQPHDHHVRIEPTGGAGGDGSAAAEEEDMADPERREFLVEKRAHVQMLRRQVDAARSSAESRALHVARVIGPAKRRDRERHQALVHTGEDHPLEKLRRGGRAADGGAPYGEDLLAVLNGGNNNSSSSASIARKHQRQHQREPSPSDSMQATPATHARKQRRPSGEEEASDCVGWRDADDSRPSDGGLSGEYGDDDAIGDDPENGSSSARDRRAIDTHDEFLSRQRRRSPGGGSSSSPTSPTAGGQRVHEASVRHDERREDRISGDRPLPEQRETKRLINAVSHREARNRATKERLNDLKMRLTAAGVDISHIEAKYEGNGSSGSKGTHGQPGDRANSVPPPEVNPRLYPGHCKIPPPKSATHNSHGRATPDPDRGTTSKRVREMDPTVLARLYRGPPKPFQDVEPVEHNICARTALIHANQEPYRGGVPALPKSKVRKPAFTEDAATRMHDAEMRRRQTNLRAVADSVTRNHVAEVNATRSKIGMAILKPPVGPDAKPEPGFDRSGLPVWTKDKATRLHDDQCARFARAHAELEQKAIAVEGAVKIHKPRKLEASEQKAAATRLHDESMKTTQAKMAAAAEKANAVNPKAATKFQRLDGAKGDSELQETFNRLHTNAGK